MNSLRNIISVIIILSSFSTAQAAGMNQEQWIEYNTKNLPAFFCKSDQYFQECYEVSREECRETVAFVVEGCIDQYVDQFPEVFTFKESQHWGPIIGKCVEKAYEETYSDQRIDNEKCNRLK